MAIRLSFCALGVLTLALVAGCDSPGLSRKAKAPVAPGPAPAIGQTMTTSGPLPDKDGRTTSPGPTVDTVGLSVSNAIAKACGIGGSGRADGQPVAPSFEYDSAALAEEDRVLLGQVAKCLTEGALKGRNVNLVGRADPRGEPEYNMTLGGSRADTVKRYMVDLGVGREHMLGTSRGEMDATGTNEPGWAHDRRVDVELAN
ncbi:MAG: peptidoglycan-associated lipoprotein [Myxococcales bacterium]|nr:peptidoglycan-associated lipoprotein [Myxococcales bacterium]